jgi:sporulation protein YlmC with PRC-barrel domain
MTESAPLMRRSIAMSGQSLEEQRNIEMKVNLATASAIALVMSIGAAAAQQSTTAPLPPASQTSAMAEFMVAVPAGAVTVTNWYKQNVYDMGGVKIGDVSDVLISPADGKISAVIVGVGGFLGMGQKDVGVSFGSVKHGLKDGKVHLTINTTKAALSSAHGLKYDGNTSTWILANAAAK